MEIEAAEWVSAVAFHGTQVVYGDGKNVTILDTATKKKIDTIEIGSFIYDLTVCRDGRTLLAACDDHTGRVVDLQTKKSVTLDSEGHTERVWCIVECGDTDVLTGSDDATICRWNRLTGECLYTYEGHSYTVRCIQCDWEKKMMISGSNDMKIIVWNLETGEEIGEMEGHTGGVWSLAFVDATTIVSGSADKTVRIWDITTMEELLTMSSHTREVCTVAVTPDRQYVVSGSGDKTVKVWSIATGECIATLTHHSSYVQKVAISPNGHFIASGAFNRSISLLKVSPPYPFVVHQATLSNSSQEVKDYQLLSDGSLCSDEMIYPFTRCTVDTESPFSFKIIDDAFNTGNGNSTRNHNATFTASSASSLQEWMEVLCAVRHNLALHPDKQSYSSHEIISRYRFDLMQIISILNKRQSSRLLLSKDVMKVIGNYLVHMK
jgi:WD40 repeat protein